MEFLPWQELNCNRNYKIIYNSKEIKPKEEDNINSYHAEYIQNIICYSTTIKLKQYNNMNNCFESTWN